jgi:hypothetical protein
MSFYEKIIAKNFKMFENTPKRLICSICSSSFSLSKVKMKYVHIPVHTNSIRNLKLHLNSKTHRIGISIYNKKIKFNNKSNSIDAKDLDKINEKMINLMLKMKKIMI